MGGKAKADNQQMIQFQMQQAAEAKAKEAARQARLNQGKAAIDQLFQGGNFDQGFYDKYKNAALAYNMPQLQKQYQLAKDQMTYDLARAGTLRSTVAGTAQANLQEQQAMNEAAIRSQADQDVGQLRQNIAGQQQSALNQLYATEDPDVAANTATHMVQAAQLSSPNLNPLGELFKPLVIGGTTAIGSYLDNQNFTNYYNNLMAKKPAIATSAST